MDRVRAQHLAALRGRLLQRLAIAAELEHALTCQYLFAAFSLKRRVDEGLTWTQAETCREWCATLLEIAREEMEHLGLACNLITALGGTPSFDRESFPYAADHFPSDLRFDLLPFSVEALRVFVHYERPLGVDDGFVSKDARAGASRGACEAVAPTLMPDFVRFDSVGEVYADVRRLLIEADVRDEELFVGERRHQIDNEMLGNERRGYAGVDVRPVTDMASAQAVIAQIRLEGEGATPDSPGSHYRRLATMLERLEAQEPGWEPARPVVRNPRVRAYSRSGEHNLVTDPFTCRVMDLFNLGYELMLGMLTAFLTHHQESEARLTFLKRMAFFPMMTQVIRPLAEILTELPIGPGRPGGTAGPSFELRRGAPTLPHHASGWHAMNEQLAAMAGRCRALHRERPEVERLELLARILERMSMLSDDLVERGLPC